jgi:hypothetical protein
MKPNHYLFACQLFICIIPALALIFSACENWPALILSVMLCITSAHEIRKERVQ